MADEICPICFDNLYYSCRELDCDHKFCYDCIFKYVENKINDRDTEIRCPIESCDNMISDCVIKEIIANDDDLLRAYDNISGEEIFVSMCPNCKTINNKDESTNEIVCRSCYNRYCSVCNEDHYSYDYCPNEREIDCTINEIMTAMDNDDVKLCPVCKIIIYREEGCSCMKCKYCKVRFCWNCLKTKAMIDKIGSHDCDNYQGYRETDSEDEYTDGNIF